jgi:hypothetical protein
MRYLISLSLLLIAAPAFAQANQGVNWAAPTGVASVQSPVVVVVTPLPFVPVSQVQPIPVYLPGPSLQGGIQTTVPARLPINFARISN